MLFHRQFEYIFHLKNIQIDRKYLILIQYMFKYYFQVFINTKIG